MGRHAPGSLQTPHGSVSTPAFMAVGTRAAVKAVDATDLTGVGAEIVLANTYHLMLRPGARVVEEMGGLHTFMNWDRPILTDSGGYQIFSLGPKVDEDGATFRSVYDGSTVSLTPEEATCGPAVSRRRHRDGARCLCRVARRAGSGRGRDATHPEVGRALPRRSQPQ